MFLILNFSIIFASARGNFREISCETIQNRYWSYVGTQETCFLTQTFISSDQTVISRHENVTALSFRENQRILFLPIDISVSFPGLVAMSANRCSLKTIRRECFKFLRHLVALFLFDNFIETIKDGTFSNLESLELIDLSK